MSLRTLRIWLSALALVACAAAAHADSDGRTDMQPFDWDVFLNGDALRVQLDLAPTISSERVRQMDDGVDLALHYRISLHRSKKFWGSVLAARSEGILQLGYQIITHRYILSWPAKDEASEHEFASLAELHRFLSDSLTIDLAPIDSLNHQRQHLLKLELTCYELTRLNPGPDADGSVSADSPVRYLFSKFLQVTGFGREEYSAESRPFSLSEVPRR